MAIAFEQYCNHHDAFAWIETDDVEVEENIDITVGVFLRVPDVGDHSIEGVCRINHVERIALDVIEGPNIPDRTDLRLRRNAPYRTRRRAPRSRV